MLTIYHSLLRLLGKESDEIKLKRKSSLPVVHLLGINTVGRQFCIPSNQIGLLFWLH
jgi:hypothetical protein